MKYRQILPSLIEAGSLPPFVYCYPTRSSYRPLETQWTINQIWQQDEHHSLTRDLNLYIHVPFCRYKCGFCNLYTVISTDQELYDRYTQALCRELDFYRKVIQRRNLRTIYIGGGTPSLLSLKNFETLFAKFDEIYPNWKGVVEEVAIEASPDSIVTNPPVVRHLVDLGLTRMNVGIQSLKRFELQEAGRTKAVENVIREAVAIIKEAKLPNLSTDLIMGFIGQTDETWLESVEELVALDPETISTYFLTIRPDAWFSQTGRYVYHRDPTLYARYEVARERFFKAGYVQESNVRYKRLGRGGYRQKVLQFHGVPVLGIGAGARTYTNTVDYVVGGSHKPNLAQVHKHIEMLEGGEYQITTGFVYNNEERIRKRLVLDLFDLDLVELEPYDVFNYKWIYEELLAAAIDQEVVKQVGDTRFQLTQRGYKYRDILSRLAFSDRVNDFDLNFYNGLHRQNTKALLHIGKDAAVSGLGVSS